MFSPLRGRICRDNLDPVIQVTRYGGDEAGFYVNADLILFLESSPETILTLTDGKKIRVKDTVDEVLAKIMEFKRRVLPVIAQGEGSHG